MQHVVASLLPRPFLQAMSRDIHQRAAERNQQVTTSSYSSMQCCQLHPNPMELLQ